MPEAGLTGTFLELPHGMPYPQSHEAVVETFAVEQAEAFKGCEHDFHQTVNKGHGRIEKRCCRAIGTPEYTRYVDSGGVGPDLHSLVMIEAQRLQGEQVVSETRYYISSLPEDTRVLLRAATGVWRTVCPGSWTWPSGRTKAVSVPATPPTTCRSCTARRKQAGWNDGYRLKVLSN